MVGKYGITVVFTVAITHLTQPGPHLQHYIISFSPSPACYCQYSILHLCFSSLLPSLPVCFMDSLCLDIPKGFNGLWAVKSLHVHSLFPLPYILHDHI
jgi:hypothetical protein